MVNFSESLNFTLSPRCLFLLKAILFLAPALYSNLDKKSHFMKVRNHLMGGNMVNLGLKRLSKATSLFFSGLVGMTRHQTKNPTADIPSCCLLKIQKITRPAGYCSDQGTKSSSGSRYLLPASRLFPPILGFG